METVKYTVEHHGEVELEVAVHENQSAFIECHCRPKRF